jgi:hypothetical protein
MLALIPGLRRRAALPDYPIRQWWHPLFVPSEIAGPFLLAARSIVCDNRVVAEMYVPASIRGLNIAWWVGLIATARFRGGSPDEFDGRNIKPTRNQVLRDCHISAPQTAIHRCRKCVLVVHDTDTVEPTKLDVRIQKEGRS